MLKVKFQWSFCVCQSYLQSDLFAKHHFVEGPDEEPVEQLAVVHGHAGDAPDELEVGDVLLVAHARVGVDLAGGKNEKLLRNINLSSSHHPTQTCSV